MDISVLYAKIQSQLDRQLPFVVYRKSGENNLNSYLQNDDNLYEEDSFDTSGFIFAPFDSADKTIVVPIEKSNFYSAAIPSEVEILNDFKTDTQSVIDNQIAKKRHIKLVKEGIEAITSGLFKKVVLSRKEEVVYGDEQTLEIFQRLISSYPNAFVYYWYHPEIGTWLGATPETLVKIKGDEFFTMALAGTQPYVDTLEVDWDTKEVEEQAMVTNFVFNELSSKVNNIEKSETYTHKAGTLLHLRTDIKGNLGKGSCDNETITKILHPTPAVCGLPKNEAKSFILEKESYARKYYTGFLGELNIHKNGETESNLFVNLRCMELDNENAIIYVGGGITKDSIPEKEWEETIRKTETMKKVLR